MADAHDPGATDVLGRRADLAQILAMARGHVLELARRRLPRVLASREDATDLAQSVVLELIQNAHSLRFRGDEAMRALAAEIFVRLASDRLRALRTRKRDCGKEQRLPEEENAATEGGEPAARAGDNPVELAAAHELLARHELRLSRLSSREREVVLRRAAGDDHRTIAAALGISEALSQRLLADARRKLVGR